MSSSIAQSTLLSSTLTCTTLSPIIQISDGQPQVHTTVVCATPEPNSSFPLLSNLPNVTESSRLAAQITQSSVLANSSTTLLSSGSEVFTLPGGAGGLSVAAQIWKSRTSTAQEETKPELSTTSSKCHNQPPTVDQCGDFGSPDCFHDIDYCKD